MKKQKIEVKARGAPTKKQEEKILPNGLRPDQWRRMQEEADIRDIPTASLLRQAIDWFLEALDTGKQIPIINSNLEIVEKEALKNTKYHEIV